MPLRLHRNPVPHDSAAEDAPVPPRRLDLDALLIPFQRPAPATESPREQPVPS